MIELGRSYIQHKEPGDTAFVNRTETFIEPPTEITDIFFLEANQTTKVRENLERWNENRSKGRLVAVILCGDARVYIPERMAVRTTSIRALGAGGDKDFQRQYSLIMNGRGVSSVVFMGHYDGIEFQQTRVPAKCGITDEYGRQVATNEEPAEDGYKNYASRHVNHEDPVMQAAYSAMAAIEATDKPVSAYALCHRTGETDLIGYLRHPKEGGYTLETQINPIYFDKAHYNPQEIYHAGMPRIENDDQLDRIPEEIQSYGQQWNDAMTGVREEYARRGIDYRKALEVQNPSIISLSTDPRPLGIIYRLGPNTAFKLRVPRTSTGDDEVIDPAKLKEVLNQANYPIVQSIINRDSPNAPFSNTHTLLIQTKSMAKSREIAEVAREQEHIRQWLRMQNTQHPHQIIIAQIHRGILTDIETFERSR